MEEIAKRKQRHRDYAFTLVMAVGVMTSPVAVMGASELPETAERADTRMSGDISEQSGRRNSDDVDTALQRAFMLRSETQDRLFGTEDRTTRILEHLKSEGVDIRKSEDAHIVFRHKSDALLDAIDEYIRLLGGSADGSDTAAAASVIDSAREKIGALTEDISHFSVSTLRPSLNEAVGSPSP